MWTLAIEEFGLAWILDRVGTFQRKKMWVVCLSGGAKQENDFVVAGPGARAHALFLSLSLSLSLCLSLSLSFCLYLSISRALFLSLSLSIS